MTLHVHVFVLPQIPTGVTLRIERAQYSVNEGDNELEVCVISTGAVYGAGVVVEIQHYFFPAPLLTTL